MFCPNEGKCSQEMDTFYAVLKRSELFFLNITDQKIIEILLVFLCSLAKQNKKNCVNVFKHHFVIHQKSLRRLFCYFY